VQCLLRQDRFEDALDALPDSAAFAYERAYALYKLGREQAALTALQGSPSQERGVLVLEAQIVRSIACRGPWADVQWQRYKLEDYQRSKDLYEELLLTSDLVRPRSLGHYR
jgi:tetratricopeptide (TPR) repeat protein